jgi:pimeloyl-ACP methyl ester carboxylesterase
MLLLGHGGAASKDHDGFVALAQRFAEGTGLTVVCIDAVDHGERRPEAPEGSSLPGGLPAGWHSRAIPQMVADWRAVADELAPTYGPAVAYAGFSMGSIFGLPVVAALPSIEAAVFVAGGIPGGEWIDDPSLPHGLLAAAARLVAPQVLLCNMTKDALFPLDGVLRVFDALPDPARKRLVLFDADHDWPAEAVQASVDFVAQRLTAGRRAPAGSPPSRPPAC